MEQNKLKTERGKWGSDFGFLMAAVGAAVGLGNIWGFPYKMGENGGFAFLLVYLILAALVGVAVMLGELALGRKTGLSAVGAFKSLSARYAWAGYFGVISSFFILAYYCVLGGMVMRYAAGFLIQMFGAEGFPVRGADFFSYLLHSSNTVLLYQILFILISVLIVTGGVKGGIEGFSTIAMPALTVIFIAVILNVSSQPGASAGYSFIFRPDFTPLTENFFGVLKSAAGQMFFSLSLGMGCMITYGSYLDKTNNLQKSAVIIPAADTLMAILAACTVMPACAAFGIDYSEGPGLLFVSMHQVFDNMGGFFGSFTGFLFYFLVFLAAMTSSISLLEVCTAFAVDRHIEKGRKPKRERAVIIFASAAFIAGIPVALDAFGSGGGALKSPAGIFGLSKFPLALGNWLNLYICVSEGILMPISALALSLLIGWKFMPNWKYPGMTLMLAEECGRGGHKFKGILFFEFCFKLAAPVIMVVIIIAQIGDFF